MTLTSRVPGFYKLSPQDRAAWLAEALDLTSDEVALLSTGGLTVDTAASLVENVAGLFGLPFAIAVNFTVNGRDVLIPMVVEEPSVVAAASHAARLIRDGGGFQTSSDPPIMIGQVQLLDVSDPAEAEAAILAQRAELMALADEQAPSIVARGGGARDIEVRRLDSRVGPMLIVHVLLDTRDAMGANAINTVAEALAPRLAALAGGRSHLRILSNLADRRQARATCRVPHGSLASDGADGKAVVRAIVEAQAFAEADPYRA
ncbi:MAG: 3-hydroxy-3-methylglutaryl-CoA reductase, partial [Anaerolineae bacterium]